jgi:hypothetical protein
MLKRYKKNFILWIESARKEETRRRRVAEALGLLENNQKLGMKWRPLISSLLFLVLSLVLSMVLSIRWVGLWVKFYSQTQNSSGRARCIDKLKS